MGIDIEKIRSMRKMENFTLKPTPYIKEKFIDETGQEHDVVLRNYQKVGIFSMISTLSLVLGDSTGLGKTLQALNAIGYIWLKEPEYVPIIVTKKSALFQWAAEANKFMQNMEIVTVNGAPFERDIIYQNFFSWQDERKSLLIMTYDHLLKDSLSNVVKDRTMKPTAAQKKAVKAARAAVKDAKTNLNGEKAPFNKYMSTRCEEVRIHMVELLKPRDDGTEPKRPASWTDLDQKVHDHIVKLRNKVRECEVAVKKLDEEIAPPLVSPGIISYMKDLREKQPEVKFVVIFDEIHALKNHKGKIHENAALLAALCSRKIGMTATPIKNRLLEFFSIFQIIEPALFPKITWFYRDHCKMKMQAIGGGRQVPLVVGHSKEHLNAFVNKIEPYYLARQKHEVAKELPELITRELKCELSSEQEELYDMAEAGLLAKSEDDFESGAELLSALVLIQQACNAPQLIADENGTPFEGSSSKIDVLNDLLENELSGVKTIVFSRFEKMVSLIEKELIKNKVKYTRVTGAESKATVREANKQLFQDPESGVDVILITLAGSESINLQAAEHIICVDSPWSYGDYIQLIGRAIRIGSRNKVVVATHLVAVKQSGKATIDDHVIKVLRGKKRLADRVSGVSLKDGLQFTEADAASELYKLISAQTGETVKKPTKVIRSVSSKKHKEVSSEPTVGLDIDFSDI